MARGQEDFGMYASKSVMASISDVGELAARLGSRAVYDRRGNVFYWDDFEGQVRRFYPSSLLVGAYPVFNSDYCLSGNQVVLLDSVGIGTSEMQVWQPILGDKSLGIETSIGLKGYLDRVDVALYYNTGAARRYGLMRIQNTVPAGLNRDIAIMDSLGAWHIIVSDVLILDVDFAFMHYKLVCDFDAGYYKRLLFGPTEYDISQYALFGSPYPDTQSCMALIRARGTTGGGGIKAYVDDIILTCNEP